MVTNKKKDNSNRDSQDLNSIKKVRLGKNCISKTKLIVIQIWFQNQQISKTNKKLVESMLKRDEKVIEDKRRHISF